MNALSLHQPWASAMALGLKSIETRSWRPPEKYVGERFVIASTKQGRSYEEREFGGWEAVAFNGPNASLRDPEGFAHPLPLGCIVASGVLVGTVPIVERAAWRYTTPALVIDHKGRSLRYFPGPKIEAVCYDDEIPWGDFSPGRWAWLFSDLARVEDRCPWCWGEGDVPDPSLAPSEVEFTCPVCDGEGSCAPVPVRGKQRVWQWEPAPVLASWSGER